jgi:hypothetical protein
MSDGFGFGGNSFGVSGQITLTGTALPIPLPPTNPNVSGVAVLNVCAPSGADAYVGSLSNLATTGATGGDRIPQNTKWKYTVREQLYVNGASGVFTFFYEWN